MTAAAHSRRIERSPRDRPGSLRGLPPRRRHQGRQRRRPGSRSGAGAPAGDAEVPRQRPRSHGECGSPPRWRCRTVRSRNPRGRACYRAAPPARHRVQADQRPVTRWSPTAGLPTSSTSFGRLLRGRNVRATRGAGVGERSGEPDGARRRRAGPGEAPGRRLSRRRGRAGRSRRPPAHGGRGAPAGRRRRRGGSPGAEAAAVSVGASSLSPGTASAPVGEAAPWATAPRRRGARRPSAAASAARPRSPAEA